MEAEPNVGSESRDGAGRKRSRPSSSSSSSSTAGQLTPPPVLVAGTLAGELVAVDWGAGLPGNSESGSESSVVPLGTSGGGAVWSMASCAGSADCAAPPVLAVGCEDGAVRVLALDGFGTEKGPRAGLRTVGAGGSADGRVTAVSWLGGGSDLASVAASSVLFAGHEGGRVRAWDASGALATARSAVGSSGTLVGTEGRRGVAPLREGWSAVATSGERRRLPGKDTAKARETELERRRASERLGAAGGATGRSSGAVGVTAISAGSGTWAGGSGGVVACGAADGTVALLSARTGQLVGRFDSHRGAAVTTIAVVPLVDAGGASAAAGVPPSFVSGGIDGRVAVLLRSNEAQSGAGTWRIAGRSAGVATDVAAVVATGRGLVAMGTAGGRVSGGAALALSASGVPAEIAPVPTPSVSGLVLPEAPLDTELGGSALAAAEAPRTVLLLAPSSADASAGAGKWAKKTKKSTIDTMGLSLWVAGGSAALAAPPRMLASIKPAAGRARRAGGASDAALGGGWLAPWGDKSDAIRTYDKAPRRSVAALLVREGGIAAAVWMMEGAAHDVP